MNQKLFIELCVMRFFCELSKSLGIRITYVSAEHKCDLTYAQLMMLDKYVVTNISFAKYINLDWVP